MKAKFQKVTQYQNCETGEIVDTEAFVIPNGTDRDFFKLWLSPMINCLDGMSNKPMKVAYHILENMNSDNVYIGTIRQIANETGFCLATVQRAMNCLTSGETPILQRMNVGAYRINPKILWKGSHTKRMAISYEFEQAKTKQNGQNSEEEEYEQEMEEYEKEQEQLEGQVEFDPKETKEVS